MQVKCAHTEMRDIINMVPHPRNPNKHPDKQLKILAKIMKHQGWRHPVTISKQSGYIVAGHGRLAAAKINGWDSAPVDIQDFANEADEFAHLIADNKIAELADHDDGFMIEGIKDLEITDFELLGMEDFELPIDPDAAKDEIEDDVPTDVETRCKPGDVWLLGDHRLMCGDSTSVDAVDKLMAGEKADMVFTDPPYGMSLDTDYSKLPAAPNGAKPKRDFNKIIGDNDDFTPELISVCLGYFGYCKEIFMFGADYYSEHLVNKSSGSWIVWDKRVTENFDRMIGSAFELCWSKSKHKREIARFNNTLFSGEQDAKNKVHPTQKPLKLVEWFLGKWSKTDNIIVDLFGGSGSTLIACEKTSRKCFMMELDPHYCSVIIERWEKYSGKEAKIVNQDS